MADQAVECAGLLAIFRHGRQSARGLLGILGPVARKVDLGALRSSSGAFRIDPEALRVDPGRAGPVYLAKACEEALRARLRGAEPVRRGNGWANWAPKGRSASRGRDVVGLCHRLLMERPTPGVVSGHGKRSTVATASDVKKAYGSA